jgi:hypothetical protein
MSMEMDLAWEHARRIERGARDAHIERQSDAIARLVGVLSDAHPEPRPGDRLT